jgi:predicted kinase
MEKTLIIFRGIPGSGKSTVAEFISEATNSNAFAADDYFNKDGEYKFDSRLLHAAHLECQKNIRAAMEGNEWLISVHNTNTTEKELKSYFDLANEFDYRVFSLVVENRHNHMNIHNVPTETLLKMKKRFDIKL